MSDFVRPPWATPTTVSSVLVAGPDAEPLTLAEGKLRAGLDWPDGDPRDDLMKGFIAAARQQVEHDTGLALLTQTRNVTITATSDGIMPMPVQAMPVQSITDPAGHVVDRALYFSDVARRQVLWFTATEPGTWQIVAGWLDPETLKREAPLLVQAVGLLTAHYATLGRDLASFDKASAAVALIPLGYEEAIAPYRVMWVT